MLGRAGADTSCMVLFCAIRMYHYPSSSDGTHTSVCVFRNLLLNILSLIAQRKRNIFEVRDRTSTVMGSPPARSVVSRSIPTNLKILQSEVLRKNEVYSDQGSVRCSREVGESIREAERTFTYTSRSLTCLLKSFSMVYLKVETL